MTTYKKWSEEEKYRIVMEGISPRANVAEVCRRHGISSTLFYKWRERAMAGMRAGLRSREGTIEQRLRQQNARLRRLVADQAIALQVFKEELEGDSEGKKTEAGRHEARPQRRSRGEGCAAHRLLPEGDVQAPAGRGCPPPPG